MMKFYHKKGLSQEEAPILLLERRHTFREISGIADEEGRRAERSNSVGSAVLVHSRPRGTPLADQGKAEVSRKLTTSPPNLIVTESELASSKLFLNKKAQISSDETASDVNANKTSGNPTRLSHEVSSSSDMERRSQGKKRRTKKISCCCYAGMVVIILLVALGVMAATGGIVYMELFAKQNGTLMERLQQVYTGKPPPPGDDTSPLSGQILSSEPSEKGDPRDRSKTFLPKQGSLLPVIETAKRVLGENLPVESVRDVDGKKLINKNGASLISQVRTQVRANADEAQNLHQEEILTETSKRNKIVSVNGTDLSKDYEVGSQDVDQNEVNERTRELQTGTGHSKYQTKPQTSNEFSRLVDSFRKQLANLEASMVPKNPNEGIEISLQNLTKTHDLLFKAAGIPVKKDDLGKNLNWVTIESGVKRDKNLNKNPEVFETVTEKLNQDMLLGIAENDLTKQFSVIEMLNKDLSVGDSMNKKENQDTVIKRSDQDSDDGVKENDKVSMGEKSDELMISDTTIESVNQDSVVSESAIEKSDNELGVSESLIGMSEDESGLSESLIENSDGSRIGVLPVEKSDNESELRESLIEKLGDDSGVNESLNENSNESEVRELLIEKSDQDTDNEILSDDSKVIHEDVPFLNKPAEVQNVTPEKSNSNQSDKPISSSEDSRIMDTVSSKADLPPSNKPESLVDSILFHPVKESKAVPVPLDFLKRLGVEIKNVNTHEPLTAKDMDVKFSIHEALKFLRNLDENNTLLFSRQRVTTPRSAKSLDSRHKVKPDSKRERQEYLSNLRHRLYD